MYFLGGARASLSPPRNEGGVTRPLRTEAVTCTGTVPAEAVVGDDQKPKEAGAPGKGLSPSRIAPSTWSQGIWEARWRQRAAPQQRSAGPPRGSLRIPHLDASRSRVRKINIHPTSNGISSSGGSSGVCCRPSAYFAISWKFGGSGSLLGFGGPGGSLGWEGLGPVRQRPCGWRPWRRFLFGRLGVRFKLDCLCKTEGFKRRVDADFSRGAVPRLWMLGYYSYSVIIVSQFSRHMPRGIWSEFRFPSLSRPLYIFAARPKSCAAAKVCGSPPRILTHPASDCVTPARAQN